MYLPSVNNNATNPVQSASNEVDACFWGFYDELPAAWRDEFEWILFMWFLYFLRKIIELKLKIVWKKGHIDKKLIEKKYHFWRNFENCTIYSTDIFDDPEVFEITAKLDQKIQSDIIRPCIGDKEKYKDTISSVWLEHYIYLKDGYILNLSKDALPQEPKQVISYERRSNYKDLLDYSLNIKFDENSETFQIDFTFKKTNGEKWISHSVHSNNIYQGLLNL